jgi:hypothetical protein
MAQNLAFSAEKLGIQHALRPWDRVRRPPRFFGQT